MDVRPPKEIRDLKPGALRRIEEYYDNFYRNEYTKALERDDRIILDLYMKMTCVTLYDKCGMTEEEIYLFLGHHRALFQDQIKRVHSGEQVDYLNRRMEEIFKRNGFPQGFFDKMLGSVESPEDERNGASVLNDSPVDCQTESVTEPQREEVEKTSSDTEEATDNE